MSRPPPIVLLETNNNPHKIDKVIASDGIWAVFYQDNPINLKTESIIAFTTARYKPVSFSNKGHAINLAKKLNKKFDTSDFTVVIFSHAEIIYSE
mgnify:CR=1|jgi:hypothetical protein